MPTVQPKCTRPLILASSSPRRQELIRSLGLPFRIHASDADETVPPEWDPGKIVETLSLRKADAVRRQMKEQAGNAIIIGSDTIVVMDGQVLGKPRDEADAKRMLTQLQGRTHQVFSGVACIDADDGAFVADPAAESGIVGASALGYRLDHGNYKYRLLAGGAVGYSTTAVTFKALTSGQIERYIATGEPMDKAGAYGAQGLGSTFITRIDGDFFSVVGLPLSLLSDMLGEFGITVP